MKQVKGRPCPWLNSEIKSQMNHRDRLLRKARKTNKEEDWSAYKLSRNRVTNNVRKTKNQYHRNVLKEHSSCPKAFWTKLKQLYPTKDTNSQYKTSFKVSEDISTTDSKTIANSFCSYFSTIASKLKITAFPLKNFVWSPPIDIEKRTTSRFVFQPVSRSFILKQLKKLSRNKACGDDNLPPGMLKDTADIIASPLTCIVNLSLESGMVPTDWKVAVVTPLYKSGSHSEKGNYRPISVLPILSKILEKAVHAQVISYFETNNLFCKFQFGYTKDHGN